MGASLVGQTLLGTYNVTRQLGEGGMGGVYEAVHVRLPQRFAIKMLLPDVLSNQEIYARFCREAEIATSLRHSHIVQVIDFAQAPTGEPFMVMEFLDGEDLAQRIQRTGALPLDQTVRIGREVASALAATHAAGVVHRDLKPQNVFLCRQDMRDDFVKVVDFGISKIKNAKTMLTRQSKVLGTPYYMAPEQAIGQGEVDHRVDIFALGAILYECISGKVAFDANSIASVLYHVVNTEPPPLRTMRFDIPPELEETIRKAMAKHPDARYRFMGELEAALKRVQRRLGDGTGAIDVSSQAGMSGAISGVGGEPARVPSGTFEHAQGATQAAAAPAMRRKPLLIAGGAAAVVALGVVGAVLFWPGSGSSPGPSVPTTPRAAGTRAAPPEKHGATATPPSTGAPAKGATTAAPPAQPNPVRVRFRVTPASARITVDGKPAASEISLPPSPSPHSLLIEAQGYRSDQREFVAVSDRELTVSLSPEPATAAAPVKTAAAPAAAPARRKATAKPVAAAKPAGQKPAKAGSSAFAPVGLD